MSIIGMRSVAHKSNFQNIVDKVGWIIHTSKHEASKASELGNPSIDNLIPVLLPYRG